MYQRGKIDNAIQEMASMKVDIFGVSEMRWTESGKFKKNDYTDVFSGHERDPFKLSNIQIYAPTQDHGDQEIEAFYEEIEKSIKLV